MTSFSPSLRSRRSWFSGWSRKADRRAHHRRLFRPSVEFLEERTLLASVQLVTAAHPDLLSEGANESLDEYSDRAHWINRISVDGRYVVFRSSVTNLVSGLDIEPVTNIYRFDRLTGEVLLVSVNKDGTGSANGTCGDPTISADGSVVAFESSASNLHPLDTDTEPDVFVRDLKTGTTHLISVNADGTGSGNNYSNQPVLSSDGSVVAFRSPASNLHPSKTTSYHDIFARDLKTGTTHLISINRHGTGGGSGHSHYAAISADGSVVTFLSSASNLHPLKTTSTYADVFACDLSTGTTHLISVNADGTGSGNGSSGRPVISADRSVVAFQSQASNLHPLDTDTEQDIFVRNLHAGTTHLVSVNADGTGSGNGLSEGLRISADGSIVAFVSRASNLHPLDTDTDPDIFLRNLSTGTTHLFTVNKEGTGSANGFCSRPILSADGSVVTFTSRATNLIEANLFERNVFIGTLGNLSLATRIVPGLHSVAAGATVEGHSLSDDGRYVAFVSSARNLVSGLDIDLGQENSAH